MLSILIPTYNYEVTHLVTALFKQCKEIPNLSFEIIVYDDGSNKKEIVTQNMALPGIKFIQNKENIGRTASRNLLAEKATFNTLLFLDADTLPKNATFIKTYLSIFQNYKNPTAIFGGYFYDRTSYEKERSLRYFYGKKREENTAANRNRKPYAYVFSGNFMIDKKVYQSLKIPATNVYGMDNYFSFLLKTNKVNVVHINNEIIHLGLERNKDFFNKALISIKFRKENMLNCKEITQANALLRTYHKLNFFPVNKLLKTSFKYAESLLKKFIFRPKPSLIAFDLYRLLYLFNLK